MECAESKLESRVELIPLHSSVSISRKAIRSGIYKYLARVLLGALILCGVFYVGKGLIVQKFYYSSYSETDFPFEKYFDNKTKTLLFPKKSELSIESFSVDGISPVEHIIINSGCFSAVVVATIQNMKNLKTIQILGDGIFSKASMFVIKNLPQLESIQIIGNTNLENAKELSIESFPLLHSISISGKNNLVFATPVTFVDLPRLESIIIDGSGLFSETRKLIIDKLPSLLHFEIAGSKVFMFVDSFDAKKLGKKLESFIVKSDHSFEKVPKLEFSGLQGLSQLNFRGSFVFRDTSELILSNLPKITKLGFNSSCSFQATTTVIENMPNLQSIEFAGDASFIKSPALVLSELPVLSELVFSGPNIFSHFENFEISNLPQLVSITVSGQDSFLHSGAVKFYDLPNLRSIVFSGKRVFSTASICSFRNLPSLEQFTVSGTESLTGCNLALSHLPSLLRVDITGADAMGYTQFFSLSDLERLEAVVVSASDCLIRGTEMSLKNLPSLKKLDLSGVNFCFTCNFHAENIGPLASFEFSGHRLFYWAKSFVIEKSMGPKTISFNSEFAFHRLEKFVITDTSALKSIVITGDSAHEFTQLLHLENLNSLSSLLINGTSIFNGKENTPGTIRMKRLPMLIKMAIPKSNLYYVKTLQRGSNVHDMSYNTIRDYVKNYGFFKDSIVEEVFQ